jgi:hypothetical protein
VSDYQVRQQPHSQPTEEHTAKARQADTELGVWEQLGNWAPRLTVLAITFLSSPIPFSTWGGDKGHSA